MKSNFADVWKKFYKLNYLYHRDLIHLATNLIPSDASVIEFSSKGGELLSHLPNKLKVGIEDDEKLLAIAKNRFKKIKFLRPKDLSKRSYKQRFDYILLSHSLSTEEDVQSFIKSLKKISHNNTRIIVTYFNFLWKPILDIGEKFGQVLPKTKEQNWLTDNDVDIFFHLMDFEKIKSGKRFLFPFKIIYLSDFINKVVAHLPVFNSLCLTSYSIFRKPAIIKKPSVSLIIPARNEEENMKGVLGKIPNLGTKTEIIFIEGHSKDKTYLAIKNEIKDYKNEIKNHKNEIKNHKNEIKNHKGNFKLKLYKQKGKGKGDAVRLGFSKAKNDLFIILDADLTVSPIDLPKFYNAAELNKGELIIGSRLVYPMEKQAMRFLNYLGNKFFGNAFTYVLGQKIKDTLCGTKVISKTNYEKIVKNRSFFGDFDPFGDFDLIFGATKLNLKILEIPIRYKERLYGKTNISRFTHGMLLLKMLFFAAKRLKFY